MKKKLKGFKNLNELSGFLGLQIEKLETVTTKTTEMFILEGDFTYEYSTFKNGKCQMYIETIYGEQIIEMTFEELAKLYLSCSYINFYDPINEVVNFDQATDRTGQDYTIEENEIQFFHGNLTKWEYRELVKKYYENYSL